MSSRRAFSLIELLVVIAIIALLVSILMPALAGARRAARAVICQSNMHQMMIAHHTYQGESKNHIAALVSRGIVAPRAESAIALVARSYIIAGTGRTSGSTAIPYFSNATGQTYVVEQFSHLALKEYLSDGMPLPATVCPEDAARLTWRSSPLTVAKSAYPLDKDGNKINSPWWPYSSSYQLAPAACVTPPSTDPNYNHIYAQGPDHDRYIINRTKTWEMEFGGRKIEEVLFPALKVALYDSQQRHYAKNDVFYAYEQCRQPLALFDGSVSVRKTSDANPGWDPANTAVVSTFRYSPDKGFESPVPLGMTDQVKGYYRWTREGLSGIDFGGEINNTK